MKSLLLLNLPRDLGDCLFCVPAVQAIRQAAMDRGADLLCIGSKRSKDWVESMAGVSLPWQDTGTQPLAAGDAMRTHLLLNLDFYDHSLGDKYPGLPLYEPAAMEVVSEDRADFGAGAVVGQKHIFQLIEDCLKNAGILTQDTTLPLPALPEKIYAESPLQDVVQKFDLPEKYGLLVPVCAANRPFKRWQPEKFVAIAKDMQANGITPVLIGGPSPDEKNLCAALAQEIGGDVKNLCGETGILEIAQLARGAAFTLGNDTGPTHIAAASAAPVFTLYGYYNDPKTWQSLTPDQTAKVIQGPKIQDIRVEDVQAQLPMGKIPPRSYQIKIRMGPG